MSHSGLGVLMHHTVVSKQAFFCSSELNWQLQLLVTEQIHVVQHVVQKVSVSEHIVTCSVIYTVTGCI